MSNPHDVNVEDLVAYDMTKFVPPCPVCGGRDWFVDGHREVQWDYGSQAHATWGRPHDALVGPATFTAQCRTCGATGEGENPMSAHDDMVKEPT